MAKTIDPQVEAAIADALYSFRRKAASPDDLDWVRTWYIAAMVSQACNGRGGKLRALAPYIAAAGIFVGGILLGLRG